MKSSVTTHILDTTKGKPAKGIPVSLFIRKNDGRWEVLSKKKWSYEENTGVQNTVYV